MGVKLLSKINTKIKSNLKNAQIKTVQKTLSLTLLTMVIDEVKSTQLYKQ